MNHKSKALTFFLSMLPGAGHMYLGLTKMGASYMVGFFLIIAMTSLPGLTIFAFAIPVVWCLSFFDAMNKAGYTQEQLQMTEDRFFFSRFFNMEESEIQKFMSTKWPLLLGCGLILAGGYALVQNLLFDVLGNLFGYAVIRRIMSYMGTFLVSALLIAAGVWLIRGKKCDAADAAPKEKTKEGWHQNEK